MTKLNLQPLDWRHDVAQSGPVKHRIMRNEQFSLCGLVMRGEPVKYVGAWDDGEPCNCDTCNRVWANRRATFFKNGGIE